MYPEVFVETSTGVVQGPFETVFVFLARYLMRWRRFAVGP